MSTRSTKVKRKFLGNLELLPAGEFQENMRRYAAEVLSKSTDKLMPSLPITVEIKAAQGGSDRPKHDHRQSFWVLGGRWLWCYRCGALKTKGQKGWIKPMGTAGKNPASTP